MIARRKFIGTMAIAAALFSVASVAMIACAWAQQPTKLPKVAILSPRAPTVQACGANMQGWISWAWRTRKWQGRQSTAGLGMMMVLSAD